jgi:lipoprotein NlpI
VGNDMADDDPLGEAIMEISRPAACIARWLVAASVAILSLQACASDGESTPADSDGLSLGKSAIGADELRDLNVQPDTEKRRRLDAVLEAHPQDLPARFMRLQLEVKLGIDAAIISDSQAVLENPALRGRLRLWVLEWRADALVHAHRPAEAIAVADAALATDDADAEALFARGWARYHQDQAQTDGALADLDRALQLEPDEGVGHYRRAVVLQSRGELDRATQDFESAVRLVPEDFPARLGYGDLLMQTKDFNGALAQFDAAVRLMPGDPGAWVGRERAHLALKRFDDVLADARQALELGATDDDLANAHSYLGSALWKKSDFAGAAREFEFVHALSDDHRIARSLGLMQWFSGQTQQAIQTLRAQAAWPESNPYTLLWIYILQVQADPTAQGAASAELAALAPLHQPHVWGDTLVDLVLGRTSIEAALVEADSADTYQVKAGRRCEADYFAAERLLLRDQREGARGLLEEAYWVCPSTYTEASMVEWERRRLDADAAPR